MGKETFVIVGASLAGAKAAETLREEGFDGQVVLIGSEEELPYERPPLSKGYLRREDEDKPYVHDAGWYTDNNIDLRLGTDATAIDPAAKTLTLDDGTNLDWDRLLLATGSQPRLLDVDGAELGGVHYLRTLADSEAIASRLDTGTKPRVVVVGSGWIGCEAAASAREKGCDVTVLTPDRVPLHHVLGDEVGAIYRDIHTDHGTTFHFGSTADRIVGGKTVELVITDDGREIPADLVVVGIGASPRVLLARQAGLAVGNGVEVDANLRTSADGIYAAGDIASVAHPFYGHRVRVEHWGNALAQGPQAARAMLGHDTTNENEIPYFFSDQYDVGMEYRGLLHNWDRVVFRGDTGKREFIAFWLSGGRLVTGMNVNVWDVSETIRDLILSRKQLDADALADPDVPLESLL